MIRQEATSRILPAIFAMAVVVGLLWLYLALLRP